MDSRVEMGLRKILGESVDVPEPMSRIEELLKQIAEQGISGEGSGGKGIQKIEKTSTQGLVDTYTITYTDATTSTFTITNGQDGEDGEPGQAGTPGENGVTPTIGENGNWFLGETDTGKPSRGEQGVPGQDGSDGAPGQTGSPGADGFSPTITENSGNTESVYKLDITTKTGSFTTPNLKGDDGADGETITNKAQTDHGTSDTTFTLPPNQLHIWGEVASLTLTLGNATSGIVNEYQFAFTSGDTATTLSLPDTVVTDIIVEPNMRYECSIVNNYMTFHEWEVTS